MTPGDVFYSKHNGVQFKLLKIIPHKLNIGIFGLESHYNSYIFENTLTNNHIELIDEHLQLLRR